MQKSAHLKERVIFRRNRLGLTQADLAEKSSLSLRSITNVEAGELPTLDSLFKIAAALDVNVSYLLGEQEISEPGEFRESGTRLPDPYGYSHFETETLLKMHTEMSGKLLNLPAHERKHLLGNLRFILDELEEREINPTRSIGGIAAAMGKRGIEAGSSKEVKSSSSKRNDAAILRAVRGESGEHEGKHGEK